jgi:GNAT acetyltransferase-like protein
MTYRTVPADPSRPSSPAIGVAPVLVGIVGASSAEAALRNGFERAEACRTAVHVVCAGPASAADEVFLSDLINRWAEKFPDVPVRIAIRRTVDAAVTLVAAARSCRVVVLPVSSEPVAAAVTTAVARRARCPVILVDPADGRTPSA